MGYRFLLLAAAGWLQGLSPTVVAAQAPTPKWVTLLDAICVQTELDQKRIEGMLTLVAEQHKWKLQSMPKDLPGQPTGQVAAWILGTGTAPAFYSAQ